MANICRSGTNILCPDSRVSVYAYFPEFGRHRKYARLDGSKEEYPGGTKNGQAGWDIAIEIKNLHDLAEKLTSGVFRLKKGFWGPWVDDTDRPIKRGEIYRLALHCHGKPGESHVNGTTNPGLTASTRIENKPVLSLANLKAFRDDLVTIGLYTNGGSTILFLSCYTGAKLKFNGSQLSGGHDLLKELSRIWPGRTVVAFNSMSWRWPPDMLAGPAINNEQYCGTRDTDNLNEPHAVNEDDLRIMWRDLQKLPWRSECSPHSVIAKDGRIEKQAKGD